MKKQVITLTGPYTEDDICRFAALMREIERKNPTELFTMMLDDDGKSLDEAERLVRKVFVPVPGEEPIFKAIPKSVADSYKIKGDPLNEALHGRK